MVHFTSIRLTSTYHLLLLLANDINPNSGPSSLYTREQLLNLQFVNVNISQYIHDTFNELITPYVRKPTHRGLKGIKRRTRRKEKRIHADTPTSITSDSTMNSPNSHHNLHVALWNARSVSNVKALVVCDYIVDNDIDIMFLTETWLGSDDPVVIIEMTPPNYSFSQGGIVHYKSPAFFFINVPRNHDNHGGIGILSKSQLNLRRVQHVDFTTDCLEFAIITDNSRSIHNVALYRPPPSETNGFKTSTFLTDFDNFMDCLNMLTGKLILLGDFNVHLDCLHR